LLTICRWKESLFSFSLTFVPKVWVVKNFTCVTHCI
jgi:hypothetical protein